MIRKARAVWNGTGRDGSGHLSSDSGVLARTPYSFKTRFENEKGTIYADHIHFRRDEASESPGYRLMAARIGELLAKTWGLERKL